MSNDRWDSRHKGNGNRPVLELRDDEIERNTKREMKEEKRKQ